MSKRKRGSDSSLELLLDTICNTFGGVLFVAILIVIMLRMTSKTQAEANTRQVSEAEQLELQQQQAALAGMIETLHQAAAGLDDSVELADAATAELLQEFKGKQKSRQELLGRRLETLGKIATYQTSINQTAHEIEQWEKREQTAKKRQRELKETLKTEVASRSQQADYSGIRRTGKHEIQTVVRYGRFYIWHRYDSSGNRAGLNTDEFVVLGDGDRETRTTPMPHAGTIIESTPKATQDLTARLGLFSPRRDYIAILVWPDSFGQFHLFKKLLVEAGFEYRLIPVKDGETFRDRGGSGGDVQ
jgi:hypothetical protein